MVNDHPGVIIVLFSRVVSLVLKHFLEAPWSMQFQFSSLRQYLQGGGFVQFIVSRGEGVAASWQWELESQPTS